MEQELRDRLEAETGLSVAWGLSRSATGSPRAVLTLISQVPDYTFSGTSGYVRSRVQIDIFGKTYLAADIAAKAVIAALSGYAGGSIMGAFQESAQSIPPEATDMLHRISVDFIIHHAAA